MSGNTSVEISLLIAVVGCFIGLAGWIKNRDTKISTDSEWKGNVNAKLDIVVGITGDVKKISEIQGEQGNRITALESSYKSLHKRVDRLEGDNGVQ